MTEHGQLRRLSMSLFLLLLALEGNAGQETALAAAVDNKANTPAPASNYAQQRHERKHPQWLSGQPGKKLSGRSARWSDTVRHAYAKIQPWNCDQSLILLSNRGARTELLFIDPHSAKVRYERHAPGSEIRWLPQDPARMLYVNDSRVGFWHVIEDSTEPLLRFPHLSSLAMGPWEGNLSADGRLVVVTGERRGTAKRESLLIDLVHRRVVSRYRHAEDEQLDWISISASGRYIVLHGVLSAGGQAQTRIMDTRFRQVGDDWLARGRPSHFDLTLDSAGDDVAVGVSKSAPDDGLVIMRRLQDGRVTQLTEHGYATHTSARNTAWPGWVFVTYQGKLENYPPYSNEIVAVALDPKRPVQRIARFDDAGTDYWAQPQAVPSPDGRFVLWAERRTDGTTIGTRITATGIGASKRSTLSHCGR